MYVYFIRSGQRYVKIGKSNDPITRMRGLQTANPNELSLMGAIRCDSEKTSLRLERELQDYWAHKVPEKMGEWFSLEWAAMQWLTGFLHRNGATTKPEPVASEMPAPSTERVAAHAKPLMKLWTEVELAAYLGVTPMTVGRERRRGRLQFTRIGKKIRFTDDHVRDYLASRECTAPDHTVPKLSIVKK